LQNREETAGSTIESRLGAPWVEYARARVETRNVELLRLLPSPLPRDLPPLWREGRTGLELAGLLRDPAFRKPGPVAGSGSPVLLIPGFLAGDDSLAVMAWWLRRAGHEPLAAGMRSNVGCAAVALDALEDRLETAVADGGRRAAVVGHSHGGTLGRSLAMRRPDLVAGVVALGSPLVDQLALHPVARLPVRVVGGLGSLGAPGLFRRECLDGECCNELRDAALRPFPAAVGFVSVYSRSDGVVDWRSCLDPRAEAVEISTSHVGMAVSAASYQAIGQALRRFAPARRPRAASVPASV
jgi:triacylglycerol lipase